jgi:hypothetical protein
MESPLAIVNRSTDIMAPSHQGYSLPNPPPVQRSNNDESIVTPDGARFIGNFHKTLPVNDYGEVDPGAYQDFRGALTAAAIAAPEQTDNIPTGAADSFQFVSPLSGRANERLLPHPTSLTMDPAPKVQRASTAAEMVELYWMAILRDLSFADFGQDPRVADAISDIRTAFQAAVDSDPNGDLGKLQLGTDLPQTLGNSLDISLQTLFRCGLPGERKGPIVSQFFLRSFRYGAQCIDQRVQPYKSAGGDLTQDYLASYDDWIDAQRRGRDHAGNPYFTSRPQRENFVRRFLTMRDLATFVNQDALHQAYFNAALILSAAYKVGAGNPYPTKRQFGFVSFGGPHILSLVSEVAARALKVVWYQKWQVHRRLRPEAYGGLVHMQQIGLNGVKRQYGLSNVVLNSRALQLVQQQTGAGFLPMPFPQGSPTHPSYGAGHATVAGACVTVLKAWFKGDEPIQNPVDLVSTANYAGLPPITATDPTFLWTGAIPQLPAYGGGDVLTVEGELNKIACNVAMGRTMGGVHFRTDNVRAMRLGETLAIVFLARELADFIDKGAHNRDPYFEFTSFDNNTIKITPGAVSVNGAHSTYFDTFLH